MSSVHSGKTAETGTTKVSNSSKRSKKFTPKPKPPMAVVQELVKKERKVEKDMKDFKKKEDAFHRALVVNQNRLVRHIQDTSFGDSMMRYLSDTEKFVINKAHPGTGQSPYINNATVTPLPTGVFNIGFSLTTCLSTPAGTQSALGTNDYTVLLSCPALTSFRMGATAGNTGLTTPLIAENTRLGGLIAYQSDNIDSTVNSSLFTNSAYGRTAIQVYGSDFSSFAQGGFVWSQLHTVSLVAASANLTGAVFTGQITLGQMISGLTPRQLIQIANKMEAGRFDAAMKSAVVNPDLVTDINYKIEKVTDVVNTFPGAENEIVSFLVYQTPVVNLLTGSKATFSLIGELEGNFVFYPRATDPFAFNLNSDLGPGQYNKNLEGNAAICKYCDYASKSSVLDLPLYRKIARRWKYGPSSTVADVVASVRNAVEQPLNDRPQFEDNVEQPGPRRHPQRLDTPPTQDELIDIQDAADDIHDVNDLRYGARLIGRRGADAFMRNIDLRQDMRLQNTNWGAAMRNAGRLAAYAGGCSGSSGGLKVDPVVYFSRDDFVYHVNKILEIADCFSTPEWDSDFETVRVWLIDSRNLVREQPDVILPDTFKMPRLVCPEFKGG